MENRKMISSLMRLSARKGANKGFVGVVFLAIALIGIVIAAIAAMSRSSSSGSADESFKTSGSVILKQGSDLKVAFDQMVVMSGLAVSEITFDTQQKTGIFDTASNPKYAIRPTVPALATLSGQAGKDFTYAKGIKLPGIGSSLGTDYVTTAGDLNLKTCQAINRLLYADQAGAMPASSVGTFAAWTSAGGATTSVDDTSSSATNYSGRPEGCIITNDGKYVYYKAVIEDAEIGSSGSSNPAPSGGVKGEESTLPFGGDNT